MKGALFTVVADVVVAEFGEDAWDAVLARAGTDGAYTSLGDYPSREFRALASALAEQLGLSLDDTLVAGGRMAFGPLASAHPEVIGSFSGWRDLLAHLDSVIHVEVHKLYPGSRTPRFAVRDEAGSVMVEYRSDRGLCRLAEGLIQGAAQWYGTAVSVRHDSCVAQGADCCRMLVSDR